VYARLDRCPLGAAAGFGVPLPLDREYTARLLGFAGVQINPVDVLNSRGRHELAVVNALASVGLVLEKFLWDVALYSMPEFGFIKLPDAFTTGSSIMPQKRNPDVVELARGRCRELRGYALIVQELAGGLPSNYHRDLQLLKNRCSPRWTQPVNGSMCCCVWCRPCGWMRRGRRPRAPMSCTPLMKPIGWCRTAFRSATPTSR